MPLSIEGKYYDIKGLGRIKLFPISKISQALTDIDCPRDTQTIRKWEKNGVMPATLFRMGKKRLYTQEQVDCVVKIVTECQIRQGRNISDTDFVKRIWEEMSALNTEYKNKLKGE